MRLPDFFVKNTHVILWFNCTQKQKCYSNNSSKLRSWAQAVSQISDGAIEYMKMNMNCVDSIDELSSIHMVCWLQRTVIISNIIILEQPWVWLCLFSYSGFCLHLNDVRARLSNDTEIKTKNAFIITISSTLFQTFIISKWNNIFFLLF